MTKFYSVGYTLFVLSCIGIFVLVTLPVTLAAKGAIATLISIISLLVVVILIIFEFIMQIVTRY